MKVVILTHHLPSFQSLGGDYKSGCRLAYATNLESLMYKYNISIWVHGHHHEKVNYKNGQTLILSNPMGHSEEKTGYDPDLSF